MRNRKYPLLVLFFLLSCTILSAQWAKSYGEDRGWYEVITAHPTADGGVIILGDINYHQNVQGDSYILKLLPSGDIEWAHTYNRLWYLTPTYDGGCGGILFGQTEHVGLYRMEASV